VLTEQMVKLLAFLGEIQAVESNSDDRGRRIGVGVTLDFSASSAPSRATVWFVYFFSFHDNVLKYSQTGTSWWFGISCNQTPRFSFGSWYEQVQHTQGPCGWIV